MDTNTISQVVALFQSRAWLPLAILLIGLVNTALTAGNAPLPISLSPLVRGVVIVALSALSGVLDSIAHGGAVGSACASGAFVLAVSLYRDPDLINYLVAKLPWLGKILAPTAVALLVGCASLPLIVSDVDQGCTFVTLATDDPLIAGACLVVDDIGKLIELLTATPAGKDATITLAKKDGSREVLHIAAADVSPTIARLVESKRAALAAGMH